MKKHFVEFYSPGTFLTEVTEKPIKYWNVKIACDMAKNIKQRHGSSPFGFRFITKYRNNKQLDSIIFKKSNVYYLGGEVLTLKQIEEKNDPKDEILISNMKNNGYDKVLINKNSYRVGLPLEKGDVVLDWNK